MRSDSPISAYGSGNTRSNTFSATIPTCAAVLRASSMPGCGLSGSRHEARVRPRSSTASAPASSHARSDGPRSRWSVCRVHRRDAKPLIVLLEQAEEDAPLELLLDDLQRGGAVMAAQPPFTAVRTWWVESVNDVLDAATQQHVGFRQLPTLICVPAPGGNLLAVRSLTGGRVPLPETR